LKRRRLVSVMKLLGLTGGIGTGKSTAAGLLAERGLPVIDTDDLAREVVAPGEPGLAAIAAAFGHKLIDAEGKLRRAALAEVVFSAPQKRQELEAILHPIIRDRWLAQVDAWREAELETGVVVIPLLFETGAQSHFDAVLCTACSAVTQLERLRARGWPELQIQQRLAAQWPLEKKMAASQHILWTEGAVELHRLQLARVLDGRTPARR
jgi:dephospho-CoA kinase